MVDLNELVAEFESANGHKEKFNLALPVLLKKQLDALARGKKKKWLSFAAAVSMFLEATDEVRERYVDEVQRADNYGRYEAMLQRLMDRRGQSKEERVRGEDDVDLKLSAELVAQLRAAAREMGVSEEEALAAALAALKQHPPDRRGKRPRAIRSSKGVKKHGP
jgi:hypothetical protein